MMTTHALVLPGGGYRAHARHEAEPVADWLEGVGVPASVFRYPVRTRHPAAQLAIAERVESLRAAGVARVLLVGFSAGAHAAGLAALSPRRAGCRVDGVIAGYPVVSMVSDAHWASRMTLVGDGGREPAERLSLELLVTAQAPPFFVFHAIDDEKVPVEHSLLLSGALRRARVPHELHLYGSGGHGFGLTGTDGGWETACERWLERGDWLGATTRVDNASPVRHGDLRNCFR